MRKEAEAEADEEGRGSLRYPTTTVARSNLQLVNEGPRAEQLKSPGALQGEDALRNVMLM